MGNTASLPKRPRCVPMRLRCVLYNRLSHKGFAPEYPRFVRELSSVCPGALTSSNPVAPTTFFREILSAVTLSFCSFRSCIVVVVP